jgi:hypothetical protein
MTHAHFGRTDIIKTVCQRQPILFINGKKQPILTLHICSRQHQQPILFVNGKKQDKLLSEYKYLLVELLAVQTYMF